MHYYDLDNFTILQGKYKKLFFVVLIFETVSLNK